MLMPILVSGSIVAAIDAADQQVLVFSGSGQRVSRYGRRGAGPGELQQVTGVVVDRSHGLIVTSDASNQRLTWFSPDSGFVRERSLRIRTYGGGSANGGVDRAGRFSDLQFGRGIGPERWYARRCDPLRCDETEEFFPAAGCLAPPEPFLRYEYGVLPIPFAADEVITVAPDVGFLCGTTDRAVVYRVPFGASGPADSLVASVTPLPVRPADIDSVMRNTARQVPADALLAVEGTLRSRAGTHWPVLRGADVDPHGRIWLHTFGADGTVLVGFDSLQRQRWRVRLPFRPGYGELRYSECCVVVTRRDSLGLQQFVVFDVPPP